MRISVVVPIYKERENIRLLTERVASALGGSEYELILVDDGSNMIGRKK